MAQDRKTPPADRFMANEGLMLSSPLGLRIPADRRRCLEERIRAAFEAGWRAAQNHAATATDSTEGR